MCDELEGTRQQAFTIQVADQVEERLGTSSSNS